MIGMMTGKMIHVENLKLKKNVYLVMIVRGILKVIGVDVLVQMMTGKMIVQKLIIRKNVFILGVIGSMNQGVKEKKMVAYI